MTDGALVMFPRREVIASYRAVVDPRGHSAEALALAATSLVRAVLAGEPVPPDALDRLVWLALLGPAPLGLRRKLADQLAFVDDVRVAGRARAQLRDPSMPPERHEIAARLLLGSHGEPR